VERVWPRIYPLPPPQRCPSPVSSCSSFPTNAVRLKRNYKSSLLAEKRPQILPFPSFSPLPPAAATHDLSALFFLLFSSFVELPFPTRPNGRLESGGGAPQLYRRGKGLFSAAPFFPSEVLFLHLIFVDEIHTGARFRLFLLGLYNTWPPSSLPVFLALSPCSLR